jgi:NTP pyrophosphatase (non-canonical NTP hydrolase)
MDISDIELFAQETDQGYGADAPLYYFLGIGGEAGEILELCKKNMRPGGVENFQDKLANEIGDTLWYLARVANTNGLTLEECWTKTKRKLLQRLEDGYYK